MCSVDVSMGTIIGTIHIKTIFSLSPSTGKRFIGNVLCSSDDSVTQLIHILHFLTIENIFHKHSEDTSRRVKSVWSTEGQYVVHFDEKFIFFF
jgi:anti-anti-sigma regulatory factor